MIRSVFKGIGKPVELGLRDVCQCVCAPATMADGQADVTGENDPTCKCTCYCSAGQANTQKQLDTSETTFEAYIS